MIRGRGWRRRRTVVSWREREASETRRLAPSTEKPGGRLLRFAAHPATSPYQQDLDKNPANYAPLTPLSFLERAADV